MKIRINGDFIRLRLSQSEVNEMKNIGTVSVTTKIPGKAFSYSLKSGEVSDISILHSDGSITITAPKNIVLDWVSSDYEGFENQNQTDIRLLIEKDFKCLHRRVGEDESDNYVNPAAASR